MTRDELVAERSAARADVRRYYDVDRRKYEAAEKRLARIAARIAEIDACSTCSSPSTQSEVR